MSKFFVLLFAIMLPFCCFANVLKTSDISDIEKVFQNCDENTIVVFDNNDIITTAVDAILQSQNKKLLIDLEQQILFSKNTTDEEFVKYQSIILKNRKLKSVVPQMPQIINDLQSKKIRVLLLTNCFVDSYGEISKYEDHLYSELKNLGIDFKVSWQDLDDFILTNLPKSVSKTFKSKECHPMFYKGMLFTIQQDKGPVLNAFFEHLKIIPKKIVFIDDKEKNLKSVEQISKNWEIEFIGIEYKVPKEYTKAANEDIAKIQLQTLKKDFIWLSDHQAEKLLKK